MSRIFLHPVDGEEEEEGLEIMDIPEDMRNLEVYRATTAHKINHSFLPNCR